MATATEKDLQQFETRSPVDVDKVRLFDLSKRSIDPKKSYRAKLQMGEKARWRGMKGGRYERVGDQPNGDVEYKHVPAIHITKVITGATLLGLIMIHNRWVQQNRSRDPILGTDSSRGTARRRFERRPVNGEFGLVYAGDVRRQFLVIDYIEVEELAEEPNQNQNAQILEAIKLNTDAVMALAKAISGQQAPGDAKS